MDTDRPLWIAGAICLAIALIAAALIYSVVRAEHERATWCTDNVGVMVSDICVDPFGRVLVPPRGS